MARLIKSSQIQTLLARTTEEGLSAEGVLWTYCALDAMVMTEVEAQLNTLDSPETRLIYEFEMAQAAPALAMMLRGIKIDRFLQARVRGDIERKMARLQHNLDRLAEVVWGKGLNYNSPKQLQTFFYKHMAIPEVRVVSKGVWRVSCNEEALNKISQHFWAKPFTKHILKLRHLNGLLKVLKSGVDPDGRMRISYNVGGTETGRWSSSKNIFGGGTNGQNITKEMREMFVADEGMMLGYPDLEQAESRAVAYISEDEEYIKACESGDLHTYVCRMIWTEWEWTGDIHKDRELAESRKFDRLHDYRYMAKQSGHSTNYLISAKTLAKHTHIVQREIEEFQENYLGRFNKIPLWHGKVQEILQNVGIMTTALGRRRTFFGRRFEDATLREAVAFEPQSIVADILNLGLLRVFGALDVRERLVQVLGQVHDAIVLQFPEDRLEEVARRVIELMTIKIPINGRIMVIPVEFQVGYDWKNLAQWNSPKVKTLVRNTQTNNLLSLPIESV